MSKFTYNVIPAHAGIQPLLKEISTSQNRNMIIII